MLHIKIKKRQPIRRILALSLAAFLVMTYFDKPMDAAQHEQARWNGIDFDSIKPVEIFDYLKWTNDSACTFQQGKIITP